MFLNRYYKSNLMLFLYKSFKPKKNLWEGQLRGSSLFLTQSYFLHNSSWLGSTLVGLHVVIVHNVPQTYLYRVNGSALLLK